MENKPNLKVVSENRDYDGYLKIDKAVVEETDVDGNVITYNRFKLTRPDAVAVIIYNSSQNSVILVKQHRYPLHGKEDGNVFEIVAGKMDEGEDPAETAVREVMEEVGYKIKPENLHFQTSFYPSPGYSSEKIYLFSAIVTDEDKVSDGGGLEGEHENIDIHDIPVKEFFDMWGRGELVDGKTLAGANALWHLRNQREVQIGLDYYNKLQREGAEEAK